MQTWADQKRRLAGARRVLEMRAALLDSLRRFFRERGFLEVETPVRIPAPIPEVHIDAEISGGCFLRASPELEMKKLLAAGYGRIFQVGPCFRSGETGRVHNPEYTMLEWYRAGASCTELISETEELVRSAAEDLAGGTVIRFAGGSIDISPPWNRLAVRDAFLRHAGWDPVVEPDPDRFDVDLVSKVEPALPVDRPVVLTGYPAFAASLARLNPRDPSVAERWELYIGGMELANAFGELADGAELARRFAEWRRGRAKRRAAEYPADESFLAAVSDMPPASGAALGVDRLLMLLADLPSLDAALPFRLPSV